MEEFKNGSLVRAGGRYITMEVDRKIQYVE
jgi:hypothetical protein